MKLFIVRHALAEAIQPGATDEDRRLTVSGEQQMQRAVKGLRTLIDRLDLILHSPFVRTRQTADIIATYIDCREQRNAVWLAAGTPVEQQLAELTQLTASQWVASVGHEPDVTLLANVFSRPTQVVPAFDKGSICCIEFDGPPAPQQGHLSWYRTAEELARLAH